MTTSAKSVRVYDTSLKILLTMVLVGIGVTVQGKVVGHWRFSGTPGQAAVVGTEFPNLVSGTGVGSAKVFNFDETKDVTNYGSYFTNAFDAPFTAVRASLTDETILATVTSAYTMRSTSRRNGNVDYYNTANGDRGFPIRIDDPNDKLKNPSFTIELIVRDGAVNSGRAMFSMPGAGMDAFRVIGMAGSSCNAYIGVSNTVSAVSVFDNTVGNNNNQRSFDTTRYHHLALVVDGETHETRLYRDGEIYRAAYKYGTTKNTFTATDCINYLSGAPLIIGATTNGLCCCHNVQFEELRYSDVALSPKDFLRKAAPQIPDKATLVYLPLDTDYASIAFGEQLADAVVAANEDSETGMTAETWTGNVPELVPDVWKPAVRNGRKDEIRKANLGSLSVSTGSVFYADCALLPNEPRITIEFFFKLNAIPASGSVELLGTRNMSNTTMNTGNGGGKPWHVYLDSTGRFGCSMYGTDKSQTSAQTGMRPELADGNWHHFAVTIDRNGDGNAVMSIYLDYALSTASNNPKTTGSPITYSWNTTPLGISYGWTNDPVKKTLVGQLDEVRISKGVLEVEDFLKAGNPKRGLMLLFR